MKRVALALVAVGGLFAAVTLVKRESAGSAEGADARAISPEERTRVHRFWDIYRQATEHRIAGRSAQAVEAYAQALQLDPNHHDALYYLGNMLFDLGDLAAAKDAWRRLVELDPTSARAHSQLGTLYFCIDEPDLFQPEQAAAEFRRALAINREETGPLLHLGEIALVEGDLEEARSYFDAVVGSHASSAEAHFYNGYLAWTAGQRERAAELLAAATAHARPEASVEGVAGEGDTRSGAAPMVAIPTRCRKLRTHVQTLLRPDGEGTRRADAVYPAFDAQLREMRRHLPR